MSDEIVIIIAASTCLAALIAWLCIAELLDPPHREPIPDYAAIARMEREVYGQKPGPDLDALTPGPVGTGWLEPVPDDGPADITGVQPPATRYLGKEIGQYVDELFDKHAEAQQ